MDILQSIKIVMAMKEHLKIIEDYCRNDFYASEIYQKSKSVHSGTWCSYESYEIVDETKLKVFYMYGYADREFTDTYIIILTDEYRDKIITDVLSSK
jgi:hypothetical protein